MARTTITDQELLKELGNSMMGKSVPAYSPLARKLYNEKGQLVNRDGFRINAEGNTRYLDADDGPEDLNWVPPKSKQVGPVK